MIFTEMEYFESTTNNQQMKLVVSDCLFTG